MKRRPIEKAGYRIARRTGPGRSWVTVYNAAEAGIEDDPSTPWAVVCEAHGTCVLAESRTPTAEAIMRGGSVVFCDECRESVTKEDLDLAVVGILDGEPGLQEVAARWRKVAHLIAALYKHQVPPDEAVRLGKVQLHKVATVAGVNDPSDVTIKLLRKTIRKISQPVTL